MPPKMTLCAHLAAQAFRRRWVRQVRLSELQRMHISLRKSHSLCVVARHLIARGAPPEQVKRVTASSGEPQALTLEPAPAITVGADFMSLCEIVILHSDHARFELLYRLLWRMAREPGLQHDPLDAPM